MRQFRDDPITPVQRHWICGQGRCPGEMKYAGAAENGAKNLFCCDTCARQEAATAVMYPRIAFLPIEPIDKEPS